MGTGSKSDSFAESLLPRGTAAAEAIDSMAGGGMLKSCRDIGILISGMQNLVS